MELNTAIKEQQHALMTVRKFVTQIWNHPLVSDDLRKHRTYGKLVFEELLEIKNKPKGFCALPIGSSVWAVDSESDHDYVSFRKNGLEDLFQTAELSSRNLALLNKITDYFLTSKHWIEFIDLLFVPDDFIVGDIPFARDLRLKLVDLIKLKGSDILWPTVIKHFNMYYKDWINVANYRTTRVGFKTPGRTRRERYDTLLKQRATQSKANEKYRDTFERAKSRFTPPSFDNYKKAMNLSNGMLMINPTFNSTSISNS